MNLTRVEFFRWRASDGLVHVQRTDFWLNSEGKVMGTKTEPLCGFNVLGLAMAEPVDDPVSCLGCIAAQEV